MTKEGPSPREAADMALMDELRDQYQAGLDALADANWNTLTVAAKAETLRVIERRILRALGVWVRYARGDS